MKNLKTSILFLLFNRPEKTVMVFEEIRKAKPDKLFIAADGPRVDRPEDTEKCKLTREVVKNIDWPCEVKTLFREKNLGCKIAVSSAIDWFFSRVEEGIILEDDCLPDPSFFPFCAELLERYRTDERIMMISGFNTTGSSDIRESYFFTKYVAVWGWASWKRAWKKYDVSISSWKDPRNKERIRRIIDDPAVWKSKQWTYDKLYAGEKDTWDYQWEYATLLNEGLSIVPRVNLIENIGIGNQATHTTKNRGCYISKRLSLEFPLQHPFSIEPNFGYEHCFTNRYRSQHHNIIAKIGTKIKSWLKLNKHSNILPKK